MSAPELTERDRLAAEHALRLLEGEELLQARGLMASDPGFAAEVATWEDKLAPLQTSQPPITPGPEMWHRIEAELAEDAPVATIVTLQRRVRQWQVASIVSAAAAVALAFVAIPAMQSAPPVEPVAAEAPLMASIPITGTQLRLAVTYLPDSSEMLVSTSGLAADGVHDHELWVVPADGVPRSLGVIAPGTESRMTLPENLADLMAEGSTVALSREELGGALPGRGPGPVVGGMALTKI